MLTGECAYPGDKDMAAREPSVSSYSQEIREQQGTKRYEKETKGNENNKYADAFVSLPLATTK